MAVEFKFTGDSNQLAREYDKLVRKADRLEKANQKLVARSKEVDGAQRGQTAGAARGFDLAAAGVMKWAASFVGVQAAIGLVNQGLAEQTRLAEEAAQTQLRVAASQAAVLKNIGDVSDEEANAFFAKIDQVRYDAEFSGVAPLQNAAASILSATGGNQQLTLDIVSAITPLFRDRPEEMASFGGALGDFMKSTGVSDARKNAALMLGIQGQARFEDLSAFKHVAPVLAAADIVTGSETETAADKMRDAREAAAAYAAVGTRAGDVEGAVTKTAMISLLTKLQTVADAAVAGGKVAPEAVDTFKERLDYIRANPELQPDFLKSGFEVAIKPVIKELVSSPDSKTSQIFEESLSKIQASEEALSRKENQLGGLTPELRAKSLQDALAGNTEDFTRNSTPATTLQGTVREGLVETLGKTHGSGIKGTIGGPLDDFITTRAFDAAVAFESNPMDEAINLLGQRKANLQGGNFGGNKEVVDGQVLYLQRQIDLLEAARDEAKQTNHLLKTQRTGNLAGAARREVNVPSE